MATQGSGHGNLPKHEKTRDEILIIGAGLTGLTLSFLLEKERIPYRITEGRERMGGRIHTIQAPNQGPLEMGATWFGSKHTHLTQLLDQLGLKAFTQEIGHRVLYDFDGQQHQYFAIPQASEPNYRIAGGTSQLIERLSSSIDKTRIKLGEKVEAISNAPDGCIVKTTANTYKCFAAVSTVPPRLLINTVSFEPALSQRLLEIAQLTHTWMEESAKVAVTYPTPFWKSKSFTGTIFSQTSPLSEVYDHSNQENSRFALKGFLNPSFIPLKKESRKKKVIDQLSKYFGPQAEAYQNYEEYLWCRDPYTFTKGSLLPPHLNNGHPLFREEYMHGRLFLAGTETSAQYPGYMNGAVESACDVANKIKSRYEALVS